MSVRTNLGFAAWVRDNHPQLYKQAVKVADMAVARRTEAMETANQRRAGLSGLGLTEGEEATAKSGWFDTFLKTTATLGTTYLSLKAQRDQMQLNIDRVKMGQEPVDFVGQPIITTEVQLPQGTVDKITASAGLQVDKVLLFGGLAAAAFLLLR